MILFTVLHLRVLKFGSSHRFNWSMEWKLSLFTISIANTSNWQRLFTFLYSGVSHSCGQLNFFFSQLLFSCARFFGRFVRFGEAAEKPSQTCSHHQQRPTGKKWFECFSFQGFHFYFSGFRAARSDRFRPYVGHNDTCLYFMALSTGQWEPN